MKRPARLLAGLAIFAFFVIAAGQAGDQELASGGVLTERGEQRAATVVRPDSLRSVSACAASSVGPDGRVTVTSCGERLSERADYGTEQVLPRVSAPRLSADHVGGHGQQARSESLYQGKRASIAAIRKVFGRRAPAAIRVASCETGGTFYARAVSRTGDYGLFQANYQAHHWRGESAAAFARRHFNLAYHVPWAYKLSRGGTNWRPWACRWAA